MKVKRIIVDELPERCDDCPMLMWKHKSVNENKVCAVTQKLVLYDDKMKKGRPDWCPLEVEEVCEWVLEDIEVGYAPLCSPKDHEQDNFTYLTLNWEKRFRGTINQDIYRALRFFVY